MPQPGTRVKSAVFYKTIEHTADIGIEVDAPDAAGVFTNGALAMFDLMYGLRSIRTKEKRRITVTGENLSELLVAWLNEVLYVHAVEKLLLAGFSEATLSGDCFSAWGVGERLDPDVHRCDMEIKAATYHDLSFKQTGDRWTARIILDV